jgi:hypothetical protein
MEGAIVLEAGLAAVKSFVTLAMNSQLAYVLTVITFGIDFRRLNVLNFSLGSALNLLKQEF